MYLSYLLTKPNDSDCVITVMARYTEKGIWINHIHIKKKKKRRERFLSGHHLVLGGGVICLLVWGKELSGPRPKHGPSTKSACGEECAKFQSFCPVLIFYLMEPL